MTELLKRAIAAIEQLPETEQNALAEQILEEIEEEAKWDTTFADPRSELVLDRLIAQAKTQIDQGGAADLEDLL